MCKFLFLNVWYDCVYMFLCDLIAFFYQTFESIEYEMSTWVNILAVLHCITEQAYVPLGIANIANILVYFVFLGLYTHIS